MDKLHAMKTFVQIVDSGSLTAAADVLGTSLPTVVRSLAALEESMNVRLMNRTTRKSTLTAEGHFYLQQCRQILSSIEEAEHALTDQRSEPVGQLTITAPVMFGKIRVTPIITGFLGDYAQMNVNLFLLDRVVNMVDEGIDVAIRIGPLNDSSMIARPVGKIRQVLCASPKLIKQTGPLKQPEDLAKLNCIRVTALAPGPSWHFYRNGKQVTIPTRDRFVCNLIDAAIDACTEGLGFGKFLSYQVEEQVKQGRLEYVLEDFEPPPLPVSVIYPHSRLMPVRVRTFVDRITQELQASFLR